MRKQRTISYSFSQWTIIFNKKSVNTNWAMQPAGRVWIFMKLKIIFCKFRLAMISVSKVASFKPNGANYIDEDTTINTEQVI